MVFLIHLIIILCCFFLASQIVSGLTLGFVITVLAAVSAVFLFVYPEKGIYAVYLSSIFFNKHVFHVPFNMHLTHFIILVTLSGLIFQNILLRSQNWIKTKIDFPLIFFFCFYVISFVYADNFNEYVKKIFILGMYISGFFITTNILNTQKKIKDFLNMMLATIPFAVIISIVHLVNYPFRGKYMRLYGQFVNPNDMADFLILIFPVLLCYIWTLPSFSKRIAGYGSITIVLLGIILTNSRSSWISLMFSIAVLIMFSNKKILILVFFIPLILAGSYYIITESFYDIINLRDHTLLARKVLWEKSIDKIKQKPFFGNGAGSFLESAAPYDIKFFTGAFNIFLTIWTETGIISMLLYFYILFVISKTSVLFLFSSSKGFENEVILGCFSGFAAHTLHSLFEDMLFNVMTNWMLGIVVALLFCAVSVYEHGDVKKKPYFSEMFS